MTDGMVPLLDPFAELAAQRAEWDWAGHDTLRLDDRYRQRQLPLLDERHRPPLSPDTAPGEFWPPVTSTVVPIDGTTVSADPQVAAFLAGLRGCGVGNLVWWPGLDRRADRMHATLAPDRHVDTAPGADVTVVVRGPWIGRFNTGRIYLPIQAADEPSARLLAGVRSRAGVAHRPLLAGYLQLTADVTGAHYRQLRDLIATYRAPVAVLLPVPELWIMETMNDLVLRSHLAKRISTIL